GVITELSALCAVIALGAALAGWLAYRGRLHAAVAALAASMSMLTIVAVLTVLPQFDAFKSARGLSEILHSKMAPGERYAIFPRLFVWALIFQGSRGIYEPDEGFYGNAAHNMLVHGDWLVPRLDNGPFLDKPPFSLWSTAAGMRLLGVNEWGARFGHALWFALAALLVGRIAGRLL